MTRARVPLLCGLYRVLLALIVSGTGAAASDVSPQTRKLIEEMSEYRAILEAVDFVAREGVVPVDQSHLI